MSWKAFSPNLPSELTSISTGISDGLNALKSALELVRTQAAATALLGLSTENAKVLAANAAVDALVNAVNTALNALLDDTGVYVLAVPIPKKGLVRLVARPDNPDEVGSNYVQLPANVLTSNLDNQKKTDMEQSATFQQIVNPDDMLIGGNAYFLKAVSESLFDSGDMSRPRFDISSNWAYTLLVAGSSDMTSLLYTAGYLDKLFGNEGNSANSVGASRGLTNLVPQNVRVSPSSRGLRAVIEWDLASAVSSLISFDNSQIRAAKVAIIRCDDLRARSALKVTDLFSTVALTTGLTGLYGAKVLTVVDYDGIMNRYVDEEVAPNGATWYYFVAFATQSVNTFSNSAVRPPAGQLGQDDPPVYIESTEPVFQALSTCAVFTKPTSRSAAPALSKAPDWLRTPSLATLIPAVESFIDQIQEFLKGIAGTVSTISSINTQYVDFLTREIETYSRKIAQLEMYTARMSDIFSTPNAGMYATIRQGKGSLAEFVSDVNSAFNSYDDPMRPPFDSGDEFVTGVVILAVAPDLAPIEAALALMGLLFDTAPALDEQVTGVQSINTVLAEAETDLLDALATPSVTFNEDMTPRAPGEGDASCDTE